jgi:NAD(P) transhydrogenase subunit alpha
MKIGIPKEVYEGELRVAMTPDVAKKLVKDGHEVIVEAGAGLAAGFRDADYEGVGVTMTKDHHDCWKTDVVLKVREPGERADGVDELTLIQEGSITISFLQALFNPQRMNDIAARKATCFAMEAVPRTTRAQSMDALSSQANIAGYKAVLLAADNLPKMLPMLMTAAGTIQPARCLVIGAGVAGLQAIATARRLGAIVEAYDVRSVVKEQIESLGAKFVNIDVGESGEGKGGYAKEMSDEAKQKQRDALGKVAKDMDMIISTAAIPGKQAPRLIDGSAVELMKAGSVIIDMAAATGGNIEGSKPNEWVEVNGVKIYGPTNLPSDMALDTSQMYAKNVVTLLGLMLNDEKAIEIDWEDDILNQCVITRDGEVIHEGTKAKLAST